MGGRDGVLGWSEWLKREKYRSAHAKRNRRYREALQRGSHTKEQWAEMVGVYGACLRCGATSRLSKDHIVPIYQGGSDAITNLQPLCSF